MTKPDITPHPEGRSYFPALDGVRAFAFLLVFLFHYIGLLWGWAGVDIFFVLSGFLITGILYDAREAPHRFRNFYIRRTLRIFPLYYGIFVVLLLVTPLLHWRWGFAWLAWPLYLGNYFRLIHTPANFTYDRLFSSAANLPRIELFLGHFWSLCVEEQFYLVWPFVVFSIKDRRKLIWICSLCVVLMPFIRWVASLTLPQYLLDHRVLYFLTPFRVDALLLGGLLALWRRGPEHRLMQKAAPILFILCLLCISGFIVFSIHRYHSIVEPAWIDTWGESFVDLFAACLILLSLNNGSLTFRIFNQPLLRSIGTVSYGAYVFHDLLHGVYAQIADHLVTQHRLIVTAALASVGTSLLAWFSFRYFEFPFLALKDKFTRYDTRESAQFLSRQPHPVPETMPGKNLHL